ncbi:MAG: hypothetical protein K2P04_02720 [Oscillospiraceae bacterium]|nr:hypothetical protein [Oscillospiraceae bacterium]
MEDRQLAEHLRQYHLGESGAATSQELEIALSVRSREVRDAVNRLRCRGVPIASSSSGYFYAATEQEVRATIAHMTHRISGISAAIRGLNKSLEKFDTAQLRISDGREDSP